MLASQRVEKHAFMVFSKYSIFILWVVQTIKKSSVDIYKVARVCFNAISTTAISEPIAG